MKRKKPVQHEESSWLIGLVSLLLVTSVFLAFLSWTTVMENNKLRDKLELFSNLGSTYYNGNSVYVRFDLDNQRQRSIVTSVENFCYANGLSNCMSAKDRFYGR